MAPGTSHSRCRPFGLPRCSAGLARGAIPHRLGAHRGPGAFSRRFRQRFTPKPEVNDFTVLGSTASLLTSSNPWPPGAAAGRSIPPLARLDSPPTPPSTGGPRSARFVAIRYSADRSTRAIRAVGLSASRAAPRAAPAERYPTALRLIEALERSPDVFARDLPQS